MYVFYFMFSLCSILKEKWGKLYFFYYLLKLKKKYFLKINKSIIITYELRKLNLEEKYLISNVLQAFTQ